MKNTYENRKYVFGAFLLLIAVVYIGKLFSLQVLDKSYQSTASNNVLRYITQYPARGLIYDRTGKLLVYNEAVYDLMVLPIQVKEFDTSAFCEILEITHNDVRRWIQNAKEYSYYTSSPFLKQVSSETYAVLQEKLYQFPGFFVQPRPIRKYSKHIAGHALGYVGEVDERTIKDNPFYKMGDYTGISGIEKSYEKVLRGEKGVNVYLVDVHNRIKGSFQNGKNDKPAIVGTNIISTIDADLQEYGEKLMVNKIGSIVAIEPSTGEILALVSSPTYDPSSLLGRGRSKVFEKLSSDTLEPFFNRPLMATYPPGSTFKLINGLIGLQEKVIYKQTEFYCYGGYYSRSIHVGCHNHDTPLNLPEAVQNSCNAYFCNVFRWILDNPVYSSVRQGYNAWKDHVLSFGFGHKLESDFSYELKGFVPMDSYYDRYYGITGWSSLTVLSLAIGQGELGITPLQMANMTAAIANHGYYFTPHIVKEIEGEKGIDERFSVKHQTTIDSVYFPIIIDGMDKAVNGPPGSGSTARIARIKDITVCGKTGTAENPHGEDHSIFVAFAPRDNPKIALSVHVENGGFGSTYAAPIASLMIEKYLNREISRQWLENFILETDLIHIDKKD
ncbi:MAG: penicillin-binding protein 2 [Bacteroidetes bacterium]|nr:penicillin-binding protein 2 [Bacteroidota bacterium]